MAMADEPSFSAPLSGTVQEAEQLSTIFDDLEARSRSFGSALTGALKGAVVDGRGLESVLRGLALRMSDIALSVGLKPLQNLMSSGISSLLGGVMPFANGGAAAAGLTPLQNIAASGVSGLFGSGMPAAAGGVGAAALRPLLGLATSNTSELFGGVTPFASDGVVAAPAYFGSDGGVGLLGEAGAEAVSPLQRGSDGALGIAAAGDGGNGPRIVFNVTAQDAASFRKSDGQIAAMLTRAVGRGQRSL
jgi:phage-related minor tail protein